MEWGAFFAGAVAMLFTMALGVWLMPARQQRQNNEQMLALHEYWQKANETSIERNELLMKIEAHLYNISVLMNRE
jgi:hypothetical protein